VDPRQAADDLRLIRNVLAATHRRIDPQMFHFIVWGTLVLFWYPAENWFDSHGTESARIAVRVSAIATGSLLSALLGWLANRRPRLPASNTRLGSQLAALALLHVGSGVAFTVLLGVIGGAGEQYIPHLWGFVYGLCLVTLGIFFSADLVPCGLLSLAGTGAALAFPQYAGYILGPTMGLGALAAGLMAERRVALMKKSGIDERLD
jgi:hypothetical protein